MNLTLVVCLLVVAFASYTTAVSSPLSTRIYVAGKFATINGITMNNIGYYDMKELVFKAMGNGTDGEVKVVHVDAFGNVYIGGSFTTVGGVATGPVAVWKITSNNAWSALPSGLTWSTGAVVTTIDTNCASLGTTLAFPCDIFMGGVFTTSSPAASNLVWYDYSKQTYKAVASSLTVNSINVVSKNELQTTTLNYVWLGGNFTSNGVNYAFGYYDTSKSTFTGVDGLKGVRDIYFNPNLFGVDQIFVAADSFPATVTACAGSGICTFKHTDSSWSAATGTETSLKIRKIAYKKGTSLSSVGTVYVAGDGGVKYSSAGGSFSGLASNTWSGNNFTALDNCGLLYTKAINYCEAGSVAVGGPGNLLYFYDASTAAWTNMLSAASNTNVTINVNSIAIKVSSSAKSVVSVLAMAIIALVLALFC